MQDGVPASSTEKALEQIERARLEVVDFLVARGAKPIQARHGTMGAQPFTGGPKSSSNVVTGSNMGEISVELIKSEERNRTAPQISAYGGKGSALFPVSSNLLWRAAAEEAGGH